MKGDAVREARIRLRDIVRQEPGLKLGDAVAKATIDGDEAPTRSALMWLLEEGEMVIGSSLSLWQAPREGAVDA